MALAFPPLPCSGSIMLLMRSRSLRVEPFLPMLLRFAQSAANHVLHQDRFFLMRFVRVASRADSKT